MPLYVNGQLEGALPADDPGVERGFSIFETFRTYGPHPFRLAQHMARLQRSVAALGLVVPEGLEAELLRCCEEDVVVRLMLTAGGNRVVRVYPVDASRIGRPVSVAPVDYTDPIGFAKHGSRAIPQALALRLGVDEVLFRDRDGFVLEASRSNLWGVVDGVLVTPPSDGRILEGVTRGALLDVCGARGWSFREAPLRLEDCEELWLSSTLKELAPAVLDGVERSGPVGRALHAAFREARLSLAAPRAHRE